jgi:hypothetical protein
MLNATTVLRDEEEPYLIQDDRFVHCTKLARLDVVEIGRHGSRRSRFFPSLEERAALFCKRR